MVGDEDQSIYGFRAAYPQALLKFTENYINPYVMFLVSQWDSLQAKAFDFKHEMQMISRNSPTVAIRRICSKWYNSYAKEKGFDTVYIIDAYDGCLPTEYIERAMEHGKIDIHEEERRLFYVAMTRAKNELCLLAVDNEYTTFIDEIVPTDEEYDDEI